MASAILKGLVTNAGVDRRLKMASTVYGMEISHGGTFLYGALRNILTNISSVGKR